MAGLLDLTTDPVFLQRIKEAFAAAAYQVVTTPDPNLKPEQRKAQLLGLLQAIDPGKADELARKAALLIVGSPEVKAAGDKIDDDQLAVVIAKVLAAYQELAVLGGSL